MRDVVRHLPSCDISVLEEPFHRVSDGKKLLRGTGFLRYPRASAALAAAATREAVARAEVVVLTAEWLHWMTIRWNGRAVRVEVVLKGASEAVDVIGTGRDFIVMDLEVVEIERGSAERAYVCVLTVNTENLVVMKRPTAAFRKRRRVDVGDRASRDSVRISDRLSADLGDGRGHERS